MSSPDLEGFVLSQQYQLKATLQSLQLTCQVIQDYYPDSQLWQHNRSQVQQMLQFLENAIEVYIQDFSPDPEKRIQFWEGCSLGKSHNRILHRSQPPKPLVEVLKGNGDPRNPLHQGLLVGYRFATLKRFLSRFELPKDMDSDLAAATFG
ncbi:hypothetical protein [Coleofasciculus chthonoplastes]|uniref:hypothetical protein n=1 Tax=Coleofasciculus chthonoplastes TaxID=64178 RepID=UPI0005C50B87|nr:hypothetical protein [Coleofasciculus chthonoplastes]